MLKISVITCSYNASATIERTLESVLAQDYKGVEHIIIDGKSTDGTVEAAEAYRRESVSRNTGHKVIIVSEHDKGLYDAMNKGLKTAEGDYIVYINAGDVFPDAHTLSDVAKAANKSETLPGVLFGDTDIVDNTGNFLRHRRLHPGKELSWKSFRQGMLVCHQAFYALTSIARQTLYNNRYKYSADVDWCIRVMKECEKEGRKTVNVNRVVVNYLAEGMTTTHHKASLRERFHVMRRHYGLFPTILFHLWFVVRAVVRR